jgi:hypothetical protein
MIANNFALGKAKEVEDNIYALIKLKKKFKVQSLLLYDDYDSLFQLFLKHNPQKVRKEVFRPSSSVALCFPSARQRVYLSSRENCFFST